MSEGEGTVRVWLLRHGERADEISHREKLTRQRSLEEKFNFRTSSLDPSLTKKGLVQASEAGAYLAEQKVNFHKVYSSPFVRCLQTATQACAPLNTTEIIPVPGLSLCCAAMKRVARDHKEPIQAALDRAIILPPEHLQLLSPDIPLAEYSINTTSDTNFLNTCERLASIPGNNDKDILLVTHREGIYDLFSKRCGKQWTFGTPPYCCLVRFSYSSGSQTWKCDEYDCSQVKVKNSRYRRI